MTLDEAIKCLQGDIQGVAIRPPERLNLALQIAIEAMEREIANRDSPDFVKVGKLPSETWKIKRR